MFKALWTPETGWQGGLEPYGPLDLLPSAQVLNYGQSVFEGMKAQCSARDRIVLFRPDRNAARMADGTPLSALLDLPYCSVLCPERWDWFTLGSHLSVRRWY